MRNTLKLIALVFILNFSSCSEDELIETNSETQSSIAKSKTLTEIEDIRLQNLMQWTGHLAGQVALNNNEGRAQFINAVNASNNGSVKLSDLIHYESDNQNRSYGNTDLSESFANALKDEFYKYVLISDFCSNPERTRDRPVPPELPGQPNFQHQSWIYNYPEPGDTEEEIYEERFQQYLGLILEDNCLEIYLPNGFNTPIRNIISSAHPLLDQNFNYEAYKHVAECNIDPINITSRTLGNIIIVRPYIGTGFPDTNCTYTQFDFDFTDFLN